MKKALRITAALLVTAMLALSLFSCGIVKGDTVMQYGDYKITEAMYSYWMSSFKSYFLYYYGTSGQYDQLWTQTLPDGRTYEQFFAEFIDGYAKKVLISMKLFDEYGMTFPDEKRREIDGRLEDAKNNYGGKAELNSYLSTFGLNIKTLEKIYYEEAKVDLVTEKLFSVGGELELKDTDRVAFYEKNYYCVNWIYVYTEKKPDTESAGTDADGNFVKVDLTDEEKAQKEALVQSILGKLEAGESFASLKLQYCEDKNADGTSKYDYYPNGFNLSGNSYSDGYGVELIKLIQGMQVGQIATFKDEYSTRIIIRNPLIPYGDLTPQELSFMVDFDSYLKEEKLDGYVEAINEFKVATEVAARYRVENVPTIDMSL